MADSVAIPDEAETRAQFGAFAFSAENKKTADMYIGRYPAGRQQSAVMALLDLAQRQVVCTLGVAGLTGLGLVP